MKIERRAFTLDRIEVRAADDERGPVIRGHAAVFNSLSEDLGGFREQIAPGAFAQAIGEDDVRALFNHDSNYVLGRSTAGTLRMVEDDTGLAVEIDPPDTAFARDLMVSMDRGDITQMSFAFQLRDEESENWERTDDGTVLRTLLDVRLYDVSPVTYPAYPETDVGVRSLEKFLASETPARDYKAHARDLLEIALRK